MGEPQKARNLSTLVRTTPVPHWLLDQVMPLLSDTELRVLLVVTRSTLGWREGEGRKESDWFSHRQLQARTGRSSAAVSRAIDGLVKREMLVVTNAVGEPLASASARSRARGRLFFRVTSPKDWRGAQFQSADDGAQGNTDDPFTDGAQLSTASETEATDGREAFRDTNSASESKACHADLTSETVPRKLRTTKETGIKENKDIGGRVITLAVPTLQNEVSGVALDDWPLLNAMENGTRYLSLGKVREDAYGASSENVDNEVEEPMAADEFESTARMKRFVASFRRAYKAVKQDEKPPELGQGFQALLRHRLDQYSVEELEAWLPQFFQCGFGYVRRRNWSLESYLNCFKLLQAAESTRKQKDP
jgi:hypothetical protein